MQKNKGNFQTILLVVFGVMIFFAVLIFSGFVPGLGGSKKAVKVDLVVWGTLPSSYFVTPLENFNLENKDLIGLTYVQKDQATYESELLNTMAAGGGPDIYMVSHDMLLNQRSKIFIWPPDLYLERDFKDAFIDGGGIFWSKEGLMGVPFLTDPLVLYWNRSSFSSEGIPFPPKTWEEYQDSAKKLTKFDKNGDVSFSGAALGVFSNIDNVKEILLSLIMQTGNRLIVPSSKADLFYEVSFGQDRDENVQIGEAVRFFNQFSNVKLDTYSWNSALPNSQSFFSAGNLAMYFGFGSEIEEIKGSNPHLDFDISPMPQLSSQQTKVNYSSMYGFVIPKNSKKIAHAAEAIKRLTGATNFPKEFFKEGVNYAPVRRDLLSAKQTNSKMAVIYSSAVRGKAWLDPNTKETYTIFKSMIDSLLSGKNDSIKAIAEVNLKLKTLLENIR